MSNDQRDPLNPYKLKFYLYVYSIFGEFLRIENLTTQLSLCSKTFQDGNDYLHFQTSYVNECEIDVNDFLKAQNNTMEFYELFLDDLANPGELIDVPILISNIKNSAFPNTLNNNTGVDNFILTRRFFLIDNISGIVGDGNFIGGTSNPNVIRYPARIKLIITLQNTSDEKIYPPYLEIYYKSKLYSSINTYYLVYTTFNTYYEMDIKKFVNIMLGFLIAFLVIIVIATWIKFNVWLNTHPKLYDAVSSFYSFLLIYFL